MAIKPTKPTTPPKALRSDPSTFPARAEGTVDFLFGTNLDYVADSNTFIDGRADAALAAALGGDLPAITGQSLKLLRVNAGETAAEFASAADVTAAIKASTANAEAGTGTGLMDPVLTKAAIDAQFNVSGAAPKYACRAWVNFNGTGTVAIRASGNVSSITDNGVGDYTVNFTTAMPDANYAAQATGGDALTGQPVTTAVSPATGTLRILTRNGDANTSRDVPLVYVSIFR